MMKWKEFERWGMHNLEYGTRGRKVLTIGKPLVAAGLTVAGVVGLTALVRKLTSGPASRSRR